MKLIIDFRLPGKNDQQREDRRHPKAGNQFKQDAEDAIGWLIKAQRLSPVSGPVKITCIWHEKTRRRDLGNIIFARMYIDDALQKAGIIPNDNQRWIRAIKDEFVIPDTWDGVEVMIEHV